MKTPTTKEYELIEAEIFIANILAGLTIMALAMDIALRCQYIPEKTEKAAGGVVMMRDNNYTVDEKRFFKSGIIATESLKQRFLKEEFNDRQNKRQDIID